MAESPNDQSYVTGIGGVFIRPKDRKALCAWYRERLAVDIEATGHFALATSEEGAPPVTVFSIFAEDTDYFGDATERFMINFCVRDLDGLVARLKGLQEAVADIADTDFGRFTWLTDPEGTRIELWEPKDPPTPAD